MAHNSKILVAACWSGVALCAVGFVAFGYTTELDRRRHAVRPEDGCLAYVGPPAVTLILSDRTDPLQGDQPRRWRAAVDSEVARLPPGGVLLIGAIGPSVPAEMSLTRLCKPLPGRGAQAVRLQKSFDRRLAEIEQDLRSSPSTARSAIRGTIVAAAGDPLFLVTTAGPRRIVVISDLLENDAASAYRAGGLVLEAAVGAPLKGATIRFTLLRNLRDDRLQTRQLVDGWTQWATGSAGAVAAEPDAAWLGYRLHAAAVARGSGG
jgi:hypothetical protein